MSVKPAKNVQQELAKLRQGYLKRLTNSVSELRRMQVMLASPVRVPLADIQLLHKLSNDLSGSGATYGFPKVSQTAQTLNDSVRAFLDQDSNAPQLRKEALYRLELFQSACMDALQAKPAANAKPHSAAVQGKTIALISSNETMSGFYSHVLQQAGATVAVIEGLEDLSEQTDVLVFDFNDKTQAAATGLAGLRLRYPKLSIVLLLDKESTTAAEILIGQVDDFLFNPFTPKVLQFVICNRLAVSIAR